MTREEFEQLVMNTGPDIYAFCLQLTRNRDEAEIQKVVRRMAEELPEKYRLVVYLYYTREQKIEEIASMLHIPKGTVKSRLHKARSMIRDRMEAEGYEIS